MPTSHSSDAQWVAIFTAMWAIWLLFICGVLIVQIVAYWRIATKAGYHGIFSLLMLVPIANIVLMLYFAFTEWPLERELRARGGSPPGASPAGTSVIPT